MLLHAFEKYGIRGMTIIAITKDTPTCTGPEIKLNSDAAQPKRMRSVRKYPTTTSNPAISIENSLRKWDGGV